MGITFRDGSYVRHIRIGKRTVKEGEFALVWNLYGRCKKYHGPRLVRLWWSTIRFCTKYVANEEQYLVVSHKDGRTVHTGGPCALYQDHLEHQTIEVHDAIQVKADQCLVVYNAVLDEETSPSDEVKEEVEVSTPSAVEIKYGPCVFFPKVRQRVEQWPWLDNAVTLRLRDQRENIDVSCNTKDDIQIKNKFSFVWKVNKAEVLKLLSATQNPLSDLSYALKIDVSKKVGAQVHDELIKERDPFESGDFKNLYEKAADIGVTISQIHFEGYQVSSAILQERNALARAEAEEQQRLKAAEEKERLNDFQLEKKMERAEKQAQSNLEEVNQRLQILDREQDAKLEREMKEYRQRLEQERETCRQRLEQERETASLKSEYLKQLSEIGVDLTKYLVAAVGGGRTKETAKDKSMSSEQEGSVDFFPPSFKTGTT